MLRRPSFVAHVVVLVVVLAGAALALAGVIGRPDREERFDAKQVLVTRSGEDGIRVRQVIDQDFGTNERRGFQLNVSNDYGVPTDVVAESPDAPDDLQVDDLGQATRIRIGDPDETVSGQHRYVLSYTQPDAGVSDGRLDLDVVYAGEQLETERFEVVLAGFGTTAPICRTGTEVDVDECSFERDGELFRAVVAPLVAGDGIQISADVATVVDVPEVPEVPLPEPPSRRADRRLLAALLALVTGLITAFVVYVVVARRGRNEVFSGGAAQAAFTAFGAGSLPPPGTPTELVSDARLGDLATIEFVPPRSIEPWEGALLLGERVDEGTVGAWFASLAARNVIEIRRANDDGEVSLHPGPRRDDDDADTARILEAMFSGRDSLTLGEYDEDFADAWRDVRTMQQGQLRASGWWTRPPGAAGHAGSRPVPWLVFGVGIWLVIGAGSLLTAVLGLFRSLPGAVVFAAAASALAASLAYRALLPARSAMGSALALRTESFRRFLQQSEGRHVEWAWDQGLVRQYSAWAVALHAADAWRAALGASNVPPAEYDVGGPLLVASMAGAFSGAHTAPSSGSGGFSGGSGFSGGGFSGGSVGGGGGGGGSSSGSW